jgi:purine-binding chemotaxis protein CheW
MSSELGASNAGTDGAAGVAEPLLVFADAVLSAEEREQARAPGEMRQYVTFFLREEEIGIPILQCREIVRISTITRVPEAPPHVRGVVNLRGHIVPAVDTRKRFGFPSAPVTAKSRLLVVEVAGRLFALIVDHVARILKLATSDIEPPQEGTAPPGATGVARVGDEVILLMDADRLLCEGPAGEEPTTRGEEA